jgi:hypothetical protein
MTWGRVKFLCFSELRCSNLGYSHAAFPYPTEKYIIFPLSPQSMPLFGGEWDRGRVRGLEGAKNRVNSLLAGNHILLCCFSGTLESFTLPMIFPAQHPHVSP